MAEAEKTIRLSKAIKEFNLSMDHIVDFLSKKGLKIESNPNTKLTGEAYALLQKEFQSDKSAKEEALQLSLSKLKKESSVVLDAEEHKKPSARKEDDSQEILIKGLSVGDYVKEEKPKKKEAEKEKTVEKEKEEVIKAKGRKIEGPTVVGKIEIEQPSTTEAGKKKKAASK